MDYHVDLDQILLIASDRSVNNRTQTKHFEATAISFAKMEYCLFFTASFLPLSCFIVDHLL